MSLALTRVFSWGAFGTLRFGYLDAAGAFATNKFSTDAADEVDVATGARGGDTTVVFGDTAGVFSCGTRVAARVVVIWDLTR